MAFLPTNAAQIQQFAMSLYGIQLGSATLSDVQDDIIVRGGLNNTLNYYFDATFGGLQTSTVAANLVQNVGITTGAADAITYVKAILDTTPAASRGVAVEGILNAFSKMTGDAVYGAAATVYNNRLTTALNYTGDTDVAVGTASPSQIIPLSEKADVFGGTSGDDTYLADFGTLNPLDVINGGAGNNTLKIDGGAELKGSISNIQNLVYVGDTNQIGAGTNGSAGSIDASKVGGLQTVTFQDVIELNSNNDDAGVEINNLQNGSTIRIEGTISSVNEDYTIIHANYVKNATVANLVLVNADETGSSYIDYAATGTVTDTLKTLNVSGNTKYVDESSNTTLDLLVGEDNTANLINTLNVNSYAGGTLKIDASNVAGAGDGIAANLTTIDATASAGKTIIDITGYSKDLTYKGGAGDDVLLMDLSSLNAKDSIVGGAGVDSLRLNVTKPADGKTFSTHSFPTGTDPTTTLDYTDAQKAVATISDEGYTHINNTGFEQVGFYDTYVNDLTVTTVKLNMAKLTSSSVRMEENLVATNALDTDTFIAAADSKTFTVAHARSTVGPAYAYTGDGVVNVQADKDQSVVVTAVVLAKDADTGATIAASGKSDFAKLVLSGEGHVTFDNSTAAAGTTGGAYVDASAMTGISVLTYTGNANQTEYVTLGAGHDVVSISGSTVGLYDRITGFNVATDAIDVVGAFTKKVNIDSAVNSVADAVTNAASLIANGSSGYFQYAGNTYVVDFAGDTDHVIQLVGTLTLTSADFV